jgi:hypothetical protein
MPAGRRTPRIVGLVACVLALVALLAGVVRQTWVLNSATTNVVRLESAGATMMHEMMSVLSELVTAQSAAVRGETVNGTSLRKVFAEVAELDDQYGDELRTHQRLADLNRKVQDAIRQSETGRAAYNTYLGIVTLAHDLIRLIGDQSHLIHDPDLDSFYLMDAAMIRLPDAVVFAGRASDLVALAGGKALEGEDEIKAAVARFGVSDAAEQVSSGLTVSVDVTARKVLGSNIAERLDAFKAAADAFAPPTMLADLATTVDAATLAANARRVSAAASPLAHLLLSELQALLDERSRKLGNDLRFLYIASGLIVLVAIVVAVLARGRRIRPPVPSRGPGEVRQHNRAAPPTLSSARDLLDAQALVAAGRPRGARDAGDAQ